MLWKTWFCFLAVSIQLIVAEIDTDHHKTSMQDRFKNLQLPSDIKLKISSGDEKAFETMDDGEIGALPPDVIADFMGMAMKTISKDKLKVIAKNFYKGNEEHLKMIYENLDGTQLDAVMDSIQESNMNTSESHHMNCIQYEPMIKALKRTRGEPRKWDKDVFKKLGSDFVQCLPPSDLKDIAGNKDVFRSVLKNVKNSNQRHRRISAVEKKSLLQGATTAFGAMKDWKLEDLKSASSLLTLVKPKDLKELDTSMVKEAIDDLGMQEWEEKRGKELLSKLKDPSKGFGTVNTWTSDVVKRLGNLRGSLSRKELNQIPDDTLRDTVRAFGKTALPPFKKRALGKRLKTLYGAPTNWSTEHIRNASSILGGMELDDLEQMDEDALVGALEDVKDIKLPRHKGRVLARKIQKKMGNLQNWTLSKVRQVGPLVKDLPVNMLTKLKPDEAREAVKMLRKRADVPMATKRALIRQALVSGGNTSRMSVREFGEFVSEFPLSELKKIEDVDDLIFDDSASNESSSGGVDSGETEAWWRPYQARTLVEDILASADNWGPITTENTEWNIGNIKKLGRLALGLKKSDLEKLSSGSFRDFAAEFSLITNWTNGQTKKIATRFIKYYEGRETEITVTDIASLGDMIIDVPDVLVKRLASEVAREAVRLMGASGLLRKLPKSLKKKKARTALDILGKDIPSLTGEDLDDLGHLVSGFEPDDIAEIKVTSFTEAVVTLGELDDVDKENVEALAAKAVDAYGGAASFDGDILQDLGKIVEGLTTDDVVNIPDGVVDENLHVFAEASLDAEVALAVIEKTESSRRKRRAVDMSAKTADELIEMGSTLLAVTPAEISTVTNDSFTGAVAEISQIKGFSTAQLQAWAQKAKDTWMSVASFTEDQLLQLNEFSKGFTASELGTMLIVTNEVIDSFGQVTGYTAEQLTKLAEKITSTTAVPDLTADDLKSWGSIALGLTSAEIGQITTEAYGNAALELGDVQGWSTEQMNALKTKAVATFDAVSSWSSAQMSLVGAAIGGFTADEIKVITTDQLDAVKPTALQQIPSEVFKEFTVSQLSTLSPEQASYITEAQRDALSSEQKEILLKVQTDVLEYTSGGRKSQWSGLLVIATSLVVIFIVWV